jgi:hypothetical protein
MSTERRRRSVNVDYMADAATLRRVRRLAKSGTARMIRLDAGLSLAELGAAMTPPVPPSTVYRWENGDRAPHGDLAIGYLALLDELTQSEMPS